MRLLILFNCFLFFCFLSVPYLIGQRSLSNTHRTERYLWLYKDISFIFQIVLFAESTDTFRCFFLARSFYDNLFQLPSHSVWSFVEDFLLLRKRVLLDFNASWEIYSSFIFFSFVRYIHFGNFWLIVLCVSIFFIYLFLLSTALSLFAVALYHPFIIDHLFVALFSLTHVCSSSSPSLLFFSLCCSTYNSFSVQVCLCICVWRVCTCACVFACAHPHVRILGVSLSGALLIHNRRVFCPLPICVLFQTRRQGKRGEERRLSVSVWGCQSMWTSGEEKLK